MTDKITRANNPDQVSKMQAMREEGHSFQEIGDKFGVSRQDVHRNLKNAKTRSVRNDKIRGSIVYKGIFNYFTANSDLNFTEFSRKIYCTDRVTRKRTVKLIRFLKGENVALPLWVYERICNVCGETFEKTFERRKVEEENKQ